jgi:chitosanase
MYKRRTYYHSQHLRRIKGREWFSTSLFSLKKISKKTMLITAVVLGVTIFSVVSVSAGHWGQIVGHRKAQDKYAQSDTSSTAIDGGVAMPTISAPTSTGDLSQPDKKELAMRLVSSAENSSVDWRAQFSYIEDIGDGRGYTAGIIGFCSGTGDMLTLVENYSKAVPGNVLSSFLPALKAVNSTDSHAGLGSNFEKAWKLAAADPQFQKAQEAERDRVYFDPAVKLAKQDGLSVLGQFMYYDAAVMHGPDAWGGGLPDLRDRAVAKAKAPTQGGDEKTYLQAFLDVRKAEMSKDAAHRDVSRIDDAQLVFLNKGNFNLNLPLTWQMYGDSFTVTSL